MSKKKYKSQKQRKSFPWPLILIGGVLLIIAALFLASQGGDSDGTPSIAVDQKTIDYGDVKYNTNETFAIKVTNTGTGILRLKEKPYIEVLKGC